MENKKLFVSSLEEAGVGAYVIIFNKAFNRIYQISRVTPTRIYIKYNEACEVGFHRKNGAKVGRSDKYHREVIRPCSEQEYNNMIILNQAKKNIHKIEEAFKNIRENMDINLINKIITVIEEHNKK